MNAPSLLFATVVADYLDYLEHEQHASASTRLGYQSYLRRFQRFLHQRLGEGILLSQVTTAEIRAYAYSLSKQGLRPRTLRGALYPIRGLFTMACERKLIDDNPAKAVKLPKKDAARRETVTDEEMERLFVGCEREPEQQARLMARAVVAVFVYAALRRQELLDLEIGDICVAEKKIIVRSGKGAKSRTLYVCQPCIEALRAWLGARPKSRHSYLFVTDCRRRLGDEGLRKLLERVKSLADLREHDNIKPHSIRHAAATRLLRNGADLRSIQHFLGHSDLQTTAIYLHTDERQLQKIAELAALGNEETTAKPPLTRRARALRSVYERKSPPPRRRRAR